MKSQGISFQTKSGHPVACRVKKHEKLPSMQRVKRRCDKCVFALYCRISIRAGSQFHDLVELEQIELSEPVGWVSVPLKDANDKPIRTFMIQIAILSNHQNGRDTHVRRIKIRSPIQSSALLKFPKFTSPEFNMKAYIR